MTYARMMLASTFAAGILLGGLGTDFSNAQDQSITRTGLLRVDLASIEGMETVAYTVDLAPGANISKHAGHGDEFIYVLEGALIVEPVGKKPVALKSGEVLYLPPTILHADRNGSTSKPTKFLVFAVAKKG